MNYTFIEEFYNSWKKSLEKVLPDDWYLPYEIDGKQLMFNRKENLSVEEEKEYLTKPETYRFLHGYFKFKLSNHSSNLGEQAKLIYSYIIQQDKSNFDPFSIEQEELNEYAEQLNAQVVNDYVSELETYNSINLNLKDNHLYLSDKSIDCLTVAEYFYRFYEYQYMDPSFCVMNFGRAYEIELKYFLERSGVNISKCNTLNDLNSKLNNPGVPIIRNNTQRLESVTEKVRIFRNKAAHEEGSSLNELESLRKILLEQGWLEKISRASI